MNIFFDGSIFSYQRWGGISRLAFEFIQSLAKKRDVKLTLFRGPHIDAYPFSRALLAKYHGFPVPMPVPTKILNAAGNAWIDIAYRMAPKGSIYHSSFYRVPKKKRGPVVVHVYDMIEELFKDNQKAKDFKQRAILSADLLVAISQSAKNDLLKIYPTIPESRIVVAYPGVSDVFLQPGLKAQRNSPYFLYVGMRDYDYKNFSLLFDVFVQKKYYEQYDLVAFGGEQDFLPGQAAAAAATGGNWLVREAGDDSRLAELYRGAAALVYPSLYEGFGIPPLEAMAAGCPVIASNASSVPEVVGDAGLLFDPKDATALADAMDRLPGLADTLRAKGQARAKQFTWEAMTEIIYDAYQKLAD